MINKDEIKNRIKSLRDQKTEEQLIERDSLILQANYLSEIERLSKENRINRKELAKKINTSPSYLTQIFRGDKALNFLTLAKIKRALNINFYVTAEFISEKKTKTFTDFDLLSSNNENHQTNLSVDNKNVRLPQESIFINHFQPYTYNKGVVNNYDMSMKKFQETITEIA